MTSRLPAVLVLLAGCVTGCVTLTDWSQMSRGQAERAIGSMLASCVRESGGLDPYVRACRTAAEGRCALARLPDDCWREAWWWHCVREGGGSCLPPSDSGAGAAGVREL